MDHVYMLSGGISSWAAAKRGIQWFGKDNAHLLFMDTMFEDQDTYRFLIESAANAVGFSINSVADLSQQAMMLSDNLNVRKKELENLRKETRERIPQFAWIADGRHLWEVFEDSKFLGNSRVDVCSRVLKRELADKWISDRFKPDEVICYTGIDWTEYHRHERLAKRKLPYIYEAILCQKPMMDKLQAHRWAEEEGIRKQRLYDMGLPHANCGGGCVKAGQAHWKTLYRNFPDRYKLWENWEQEIYKKVPNAKPFLKKTVNKEVQYLSLKEFREKYLETESSLIDLFDWGGCGCFIDQEGDKNSPA